MTDQENELRTQAGQAGIFGTEQGATLLSHANAIAACSGIVAHPDAAPRVTPADMEANIASEWYFTGAQGCQGAAAAGTPLSQQPPISVRNPLNLLTFCVLVLRNGFTVTGESACVSPENFDAGMGQKIARAKAVEKMWPLMGYALKEQLHQRKAQI